jgi:hypothetical protein
MTKKEVSMTALELLVLGGDVLLLVVIVQLSKVLKAVSFLESINHHVFGIGRAMPPTEIPRRTTIPL